ncbi:MAG: hypothetical protein LBM98_02355 [Oscillospiraceae bacterium]|nr:hypothetical protein [Oscillospiraceae bacterium]
MDAGCDIWEAPAKRIYRPNPYPLCGGVPPAGGGVVSLRRAQMSLCK